MSRSKQEVRDWRIEGFDSSTRLFEQTFSTRQMTTRQVKELLRALASRHLTDSEIVGAYATRGTRIANRHLEIQTERDDENRRMIYTCGNNPYYTACPVSVASSNSLASATRLRSKPATT